VRFRDVGERRLLTARIPSCVQVMTAGWVTTKEVSLLLGEMFRCVPLRDAVRPTPGAAEVALGTSPRYDWAPLVRAKGLSLGASSIRARCTDERICIVCA
jgi:hypothetical protein